MKHLLRPYRKFQIEFALAALVVTAGCLLSARVARAQALQIGPLLDESSFMLAKAGTPGYLGVDVTDVDTEKAQTLRLKEVRGALITLIDHDAPAGQIGLKVNDVVLGINGQNIDNADQLRRALREIPPGTKVGIVISRDGNIQTLAVQLVDRKAMERDIWSKIGIDVDGIAPPAPPPTMGLVGGDAPVSSGFHMSIFGSTLNVGALVEPLTSQMAEYFGVPGGLMIKQVARKSEAAAAGFKAFDVILKVGPETINTSADWDRALRSNQGKSVQVVILRDKKQQTLTLQVDSRHRGAVEFEDLFSSDDALLLADLAPGFDDDLAQILSAQAAADAGAIAGAMRAQAETLRLQMDEFQKSFSNRQMKQLQQQMEQFHRQMQQWCDQSTANFV